MNETETKVNAILDRYKRKESFLISMLQDIQEEFNYLPKESLEIVAKELKLPLAQIYGVVTFFRAFTLKQTGKYIIKVCTGTSCHIRGGKNILKEFEDELKIKAKETTEDGKFTLELVHCLGACALGPVAIINEDYYEKITIPKIPSIIKKYKEVKNDKK